MWKLIKLDWEDTQVFLFVTWDNLYQYVLKKYNIQLSKEMLPYQNKGDFLVEEIKIKNGCSRLY